MVKTRGSTSELLFELENLRKIGVSGILGVEVEFIDIKRNIGGEGGLLDLF